MRRPINFTKGESYKKQKKVVTVSLRAVTMGVLAEHMRRPHAENLTSDTASLTPQPTNPWIVSKEPSDSYSPQRASTDHTVVSSVEKIFLTKLTLLIGSSKEGLASSW